MLTSPKPQDRDFSRDLLGRYICNGLDEALASTALGAPACSRESVGRILRDPEQLLPPA